MQLLKNKWTLIYIRSSLSIFLIIKNPENSNKAPIINRMFPIIDERKSLTAEFRKKYMPINPAMGNKEIMLLEN